MHVVSTVFSVSLERIDEMSADVKKDVFFRERVLSEKVPMGTVAAPSECHYRLLLNIAHTCGATRGHVSAAVGLLNDLFMSPRLLHHQAHVAAAACLHAAMVLSTPTPVPAPEATIGSGETPCTGTAAPAAPAGGLGLGLTTLSALDRIITADTANFKPHEKAGTWVMTGAGAASAMELAELDLLPGSWPLVPTRTAPSSGCTVAAAIVWLDSVLGQWVGR